MTQLTLTLMRHAKSSWKVANQSDHDRPLNKRGNTDAVDMAQRLLQRGSVPQVIVSSSAERTRQTTAHVAQVFAANTPTILFHDALYLAAPTALLKAALDVSDSFNHIMLIAHNPGIEDLSAHLQSTGHDVMPTAAIRQFTFSSSEHLQLAAESLHLSSLIDFSDDVVLQYSDFPKSR